MDEVSDFYGNTEAICNKAVSTQDNNKTTTKQTFEQRS